MIRATSKLLVSHHARRLHYAARRQLASASNAAAATSTSSSSENWSVGSLAAGLSALGVGLAAVQSCRDENTSMAQCENAQNQPSWEDYDDDAEGEGKTMFQTIPVSELDVNQDDDGGKSERAFNSAVKNGLFNTYDDGTDDWEQEETTNDDTKESPPSNVDPNIGNHAAVQERFVSFSPMNTPANIQPRMSIRHTNRKEQRPNTDQHDNVLASSSMKIIEKAPKPMTEEEIKENDKVILKRIKTVRRQGLGENQVYTKNMYFYQSVKIKDYMRNKFRLFALPSSEKLGSEMAFLLGTDLNSIDVGAFTDGETAVKIEDQCRGKECFVVCTTTSTNAILELLLTISALRRGSAKRICAVIPYYGYSRQDRKTMEKREPIAAADMAKLLEEMGIDSVITVDLHNPLVKGFFSPTIPVDMLMPGPVAAAYFYEELFGTKEATDDSGDETKEEKEPKEMPKITVVAAHENQVFRANRFRNALQKLSGSDDINVALITNTKAFKWDEKNGGTTTLVGDVQGRKCIIVDDIINTGGTMVNAIDMVGKSGASEVYAWSTHGVLHLPENDAPQKIQDLDCLKYLLISNSVSMERELPPKIRKLSIAPLLAEAVARALHHESISSMLTLKPQKTEK